MTIVKKQSKRELRAEREAQRAKRYTLELSEQDRFVLMGPLRKLKGNQKTPHERRLLKFLESLPQTGSNGKVAKRKVEKPPERSNAHHKKCTEPLKKAREKSERVMAKRAKKAAKKAKEKANRKGPEMAEPILDKEGGVTWVYEPFSGLPIGFMKRTESAKPEWIVQFDGQKTKSVHQMGSKKVAAWMYDEKRTKKDKLDERTLTYLEERSGKPTGVTEIADSSGVLEGTHSEFITPTAALQSMKRMEEEGLVEFVDRLPIGASKRKKEPHYNITKEGQKLVKERR